MAKEGKSGVTAKTPENIVFGAGTIHKGLKHEGSTWNFAETLVGATSGGSKISIVPEFTKIEVDGALVATKGLTVKTGEVATMEINLAELTEDIIKAAAFAMESTDGGMEHKVLVSKPNIEEGDYWENIAFVGRTTKDERVLVIMPNALCTSGFEIEAKNKENSVGKYTFECNADLESELDKLPWEIHYLDK